MLALVMTSCSGEPEPPDGTATVVRLPCAEGTSATPAPIDTGVTPLKGAATFSTQAAVRVTIALEEAALAQARLAEGRALTSEVKAYADLVIEERSAHLTRLHVLAERTQKTMHEDRTPALLQTEMEASRVQLEALDRTSFDLPFMTAEMTMAARILGLIDAALLPSAAQAMVVPGADGSERVLDKELRDLRTAYAERIVHAIRVQGVLRAAESNVGAAGESNNAKGRGPALPQ